MAITLANLLEGLAPVPLHWDRPVTGLALDSRRVRSGDLFLAVQGHRTHGLDFWQAARAAGAVAVAWEPPAPGPLPEGANLPLVAVENLGRRLGLIAGRLHRWPARQLALIGITGTDGKTSCCHFIAQALADDGPCGVMGTLGYGLPGELTPASHTTPDALTLQDWLARFRDRGVERVAMEVSSHALAQGRVDELHFRVALLTHVSRDHLDYHGNLQAYTGAKRRLFTEPVPDWAVLNLADALGRRLAGELAGRARLVGYGAELPGQDWLRAEDLQLLPAGLRLTVRSSRGDGKLTSKLLGRFNSENLLGVLGVLLALEVPLEEALDRLARVTTVPGRMERFQAPGRPLAVVDYAHTPHALGQVLEALREHARGRVWCVFGCGGDRDPGKRPEMGATAEALAAQVIVTDDNPRNEERQRIHRQILAGMQDPGRARLVPDREEAIRYALAGAEPEDIVLIAGKGHEDYQIVGDQNLPFSDRAVVCRWLEEQA